MYAKRCPALYAAVGITTAEAEDANTQADFIVSNDRERPGIVDNTLVLRAIVNVS